MKAIINEKLYDTTISSVVLAHGSIGIYKTPNGTYFKTTSSGIAPMTDDEVKEYLGIYDVDTYVKEFGEVPSA